MIDKTHTVMNCTSKIFLTKSLLTYFSTATCIESDDINSMVISLIQTKEYLSRVATREETDPEKWNLGQMCHDLVCRHTDPPENTMPLISLELEDTES